MQYQPNKLVNGAPVILRVVAPSSVKSLSGTWLEHTVFFDLDSKTRAWVGFVGIPVEAKPGPYELTLKGVSKEGQEISFVKKLTVRAGKYQSFPAPVTVAKRFTEPDPVEVKQIADDKALKEKTFSEVEPVREWSGEFRAPASATISDVFGTRRTFNGKVQSIHQGLDYAVPTGTPVTAVNRGTVILARPMFFEGNFVVIDHGQGLMTLYLHLSEIKVKEGEQVARGQLLGLSGGTGRATGPHLHVAVRWQGIYVNPATLFELRPPSQ